MRVQRTTERPQGHSVSYTQLSKPCGLQLKFHRQRVPNASVGVFLLYGRALHAGVEARSKGRARTDQEAARMAVNAFRHEVRTARLPIQWDEPWKMNQDGGHSADTYGNLATPEVCEWWLQRQVPVYLERFPDQKVTRSEHRIFVPLTAPEGVTWKHPWSLECFLDREMEDGGVVDLKSTQKAWSDQDVRKYRVQALVYQAAYFSFYGRRPAYFEFHVLPRMRAGEAGGYHAREEVQVIRVGWDSKTIQAYLDGVVKPQITAIEAGTYVANPGSSLCSPRWCQYWGHCRLGGGENL